MVKWLYDRYAIVSIITVSYLLLIGFGTYQMFVDVSLITGSAATAYGTLMMLPAAIAGILKWRFNKDNE